MYRLRDMCETNERHPVAVAHADQDRCFPEECAELAADTSAEQETHVGANGPASVNASASSLAPEAWLVDAASSGDVLEIVVVLRGKVRRRSGDPPGLWTMRLLDGHYRVFSPDSVIAATPIAKRRAPRAR